MLFKKRSKKEIFYAPVIGTSIPLSEVNDEMFSHKLLGNGVAFQLRDDTIYAPCDGKINMVASTKHALGITSTNGTEIMIHIGLDTVNLNGQGFTVMVDSGAKIKKGQALVQLDQSFMTRQQVDLTTMMIVTNQKDYNLVLSEYGSCQLDDPVFTTEKKE